MKLKKIKKSTLIFLTFIILLTCTSCNKKVEFIGPDIGKTVDISTSKSSNTSEKEESKKEENKEIKEEKTEDKDEKQEKIEEKNDKKVEIAKKTFGNKELGYITLNEDFLSKETTNDGVNELLLISASGNSVITLKKFPKNEEMNDPHMFASNFMAVMASEDPNNIQGAKIKFTNFNPVYEIYKYSSDGSRHYFLWFMGNSSDNFVHMVTLETSSEEVAQLSKMIQTSYKTSK